MGQLGRAGYGSVAIVIQMDAKEDELTAVLPEAEASSVDSTASKRSMSRRPPASAAAE